MGNRQQEHRSLLRSAGLMSLLTLMSRVGGMVRDILCAKMFGTSRIWDAFLYAFSIPNFLRRLVGEGALSNAFIPVYAQVLKAQGKEEADRVANIVSTVLSIFLGILIVGFTLGVRYLLGHFTFEEKGEWTLRFLLILFPYIFFLAHVALSMGILNCHKHFFTPSLSPVLLNAIWILAVLFVCPIAPTIEGKGTLLAWTILFSGVLQFGIQLFPLTKFGFRMRFVLDFFHPAIKKISVLIVPAILSFAVTQVSILVDSTMAFFVRDGANSALWYGNRLMQFPLGLFGVGFGAVLLPMISEKAAEDNMKEIIETLSFSIRTVFLIVVPASMGLIFLKTPIVKTLFERGNFDAVSTLRTANVLMFYSIGLFAYSGQKSIASAFYGIQDAKTPFIISASSLGIDIALNFLLIGPLKEGGLALSTSLGGILDFVLLMILFKRKIPAFDLKDILVSFLKILAASLIMGVTAWWLYRNVTFGFPSVLWNQIAGLSLSIGLAMLIYVALCFLFRVREIYQIVKIFGRAERQPPLEE